MKTWKTLFQSGTWTPSPRTLTVRNTPLPEHIPFDESTLQFYDAHSNSYNFGHYILDNVMPHFIGADQFDLPLQSTRQIFETSCRRFGSQGDRMANTRVPFNASMGTFRSACLDKINSLWKYFFDFPPLYLEPLYTKDICFSNLLIGQSSTYGLHTIELARAGYIRRFRDFVINRIAIKDTIPIQENIILIGIRSEGHSGGEQLKDLCNFIKGAFEILPNKYKEKYVIKCIVNQDLEFVDEIKHVQQAKVLISVHGTISSME